VINDEQHQTVPCMIQDSTLVMKSPDVKVLSEECVISGSAARRSKVLENKIKLTNARLHFKTFSGVTTPDSFTMDGGGQLDGEDS